MAVLAQRRVFGALVDVRTRVAVPAETVVAHALNEHRNTRQSSTRFRSAFERACCVNLPIIARTTRSLETVVSFSMSRFDGEKHELRPKDCVCGRPERVCREIFFVEIVLRVERNHRRCLSYLKRAFFVDALCVLITTSVVGQTLVDIHTVVSVAGETVLTPAAVRSLRMSGKTLVVQ